MNFKIYLHRLRMINYHLLVRGPSLVKGYLLGNGIKAYWFRDVVNFGDLITPLLLKTYGYTPVHTQPHKASLIATGSILEHLPESYSGYILGSGFISEDSRVAFSQAKVFSVRGELSRERLGGEQNGVALGDPGLLAARLLQMKESKKYLLGIIPHHVDIASPVVASLLKNYPANVSVIDPQQQPMEVFRLIDQCEHILSSSLHGLIVADSLAIPNGWLFAEGLTGNRFKFDDYYSSLRVPAGVPFKLTGNESLEKLVSMTSSKPASRIKELQDNLHELWSNLGKSL